MASERTNSSEGRESGTVARPLAHDVQLSLGDESVSITLRRAWDRTLRLLSQRVNKPTFETHLRGLKPLSLATETDDRGHAGYVVTVGAPSAFTRQWVEGRHAPLIREVLEEVLDAPVRLILSLAPKEDAGGATGQIVRPAPPRPAPPSTAHTGGSEPPPVAPTKALQHLPASGAALGEAQLGATRQAAPTGAEARRSAPDSVPSTMPAPRGDSPRNHPDAPQFNPRYTFDRFVVGANNRLAHGGALAVAEAPSERYNPLFLYGSPGLGKTHLLHAIANNFIARGGEAAAKRVAYMSGEAFTAQYITSLRHKKADEFRRRLKSADLWLVDDIQFIASREQTKEEFFHTFNALRESGKQIVICSDRSPRELTAMDERLQSRFESGLVADITAPGLEMRLAILQDKAAYENTRVPDDVLLYMARLVQSNIRTLEGALVKLMAYASLVNSPVTTQMAEGILEKYFISGGASAEGIVSGAAPTAPGTGSARLFSAAPTPTPKFITPASPLAAHAPFHAARTDDSSARQNSGEAKLPAGAKLSAEMVERAVAARFGVTLDELHGKRRDRDAVNARQLAMHLLRELTDVSLPGIGQLFGGRDHTTVIHACDRVKAQLPIDADLRALIADLMTEMRRSGGTSPFAPSTSPTHSGLQP